MIMILKAEISRVYNNTPPLGMYRPTDQEEPRNTNQATLRGSTTHFDWVTEESWMVVGCWLWHSQTHLLSHTHAQTSLNEGHSAGDSSRDINYWNGEPTMTTTLFCIQHGTVTLIRIRFHASSPWTERGLLGAQCFCFRISGHKTGGDWRRSLQSFWGSWCVRGHLNEHRFYKLCKKWGGTNYFSRWLASPHFHWFLPQLIMLQGGA